MSESGILAFPPAPDAGASRACDILREAGLPVDAEQERALARYAQLLREWNARLNLISRKDEAELWRNHLLHSLAPLALLQLPAGGYWIDIGTGGGLPGIPLSILRPDTRFLLCDSIAKKIRAVEAMAGELQLANVHCLNARVEDAAVRDILGRDADVVVARAVTALPALAAWASPLLRRDGPRILLAWKGGDIADELTETRARKDVRSIETHALALPGEPYFVEQDKKVLRVFFSGS